MLKGGVQNAAGQTQNKLIDDVLGQLGETVLGKGRSHQQEDTEPDKANDEASWRRWESGDREIDYS